MEISLFQIGILMLFFVGIVVIFRESKKENKIEDEVEIVKCYKCKHLIEKDDVKDVVVIEINVWKRIPKEHRYYCKNCEPNYDYIKTSSVFGYQYFKTFEVDEKGKIKK